MPGAYAHITLVNLLKETRRLQAFNIPTEIATALLDYFKFVELGAVSPDTHIFRYATRPQPVGLTPCTMTEREKRFSWEHAGFEVCKGNPSAKVLPGYSATLLM